MVYITLSNFRTRLRPKKHLQLPKNKNHPICLHHQSTARKPSRHSFVPSIRLRLRLSLPSRPTATYVRSIHSNIPQLHPSFPSIQPPIPDNPPNHPRKTSILPIPAHGENESFTGDSSLHPPPAFHPHFPSRRNISHFIPNNDKQSFYRSNSGDTQSNWFIHSNYYPQFAPRSVINH